MQKSSFSIFEDIIKFPKDELVLPEPQYWEITLGNSYDFLHSHNSLEFGINLSGKGVWHINDKTINFDGLTYSFIGPGVWHSAHTTSPTGSKWLFIYINHQKLLENSPELVSAVRNQYVIASQKQDPTIYALIDSFIKLARKKEEETEQILSNLLKVILLSIYKGNEPSKEKHKNLKYILPAINYINANYMEEIDLEQLSKLCYCSKSTLRRYFLEATGMSPYRFIENVRLANAKDMLGNQKKILDVAIDCGYQSITSFNRQFKKETGITPREYRSQHG